MSVSRNEELERLRRLLLDEDRRESASLAQRIEALERVRDDLPVQMPRILRRAAAGDGAARLGEALATPVSNALSASIRSQPGVVVDALFPVIGPSIRRAVSEAMRGFVREVNDALASGLSLRGLRWRIESWRSGVPYSQVLLRHTLGYSIDHAFLIERDSGLLLQHAAAPGAADLDADAIAGMLTAIGQFVRDSVDREGDGLLESARVGDYQLELVSAPRLTLACFVTGVVPARLHDAMSEIVEDIHGVGAADVDTEAARDVLQPAAIVRRIGEPRVLRRPVTSIWPFVLFLMLLVSAVSVWLLQRQWRWEQGVEALRSELLVKPGFALTGIESRPWKSVEIHGLIDPDADPVVDISSVDLGGVRPQWNLQDYISAADPVIRKRALRILQPPDEVTLHVADGVLRLGGHAGSEWRRMAAAQAALVPGVRRVEIDIARTQGDLVRMAEQLSRLRVTFSDGDVPRDDPEIVLDELVSGIVDAKNLAKALGVALTVRVLGDNDQPGSDRANERVRELRRDWLARALIDRGVPADLLDVSANGDTRARVARIEMKVGEGR